MTWCAEILGGVMLIGGVCVVSIAHPDLAKRAIKYICPMPGGMHPCLNRGLRRVISRRYIFGQ